MWQSEDDVLRDIASLNDFGAPEDKESYNILYSVGRGLKTKEKPRVSKKFIDTRTGEAIDLEDAVLDTNNGFCKSKGRGSVLGSFFRTRLQLQQQLRLARPLGSGDEAIENYYGKSRSMEQFDSSVEAPNSEPVANNSLITPESHNAVLNSDKIKKRVKATRNSCSQGNALISNLLSKDRIRTDSGASTKHDSMDCFEQKKHFSSNNSNKCNRDDVIDDLQKSSLSDLNFSDLYVSSKLNKEVSSLGKNADYFKENLNKIMPEKEIEEENHKIIDNNEEVLVEFETKEAMKDSSNLKKININFGINEKCNSLESESDCNLKYKALGERLNRLREIRSNVKQNGNLDSDFLLDSSTPRESIIFVEEDFPPLKKI